jgi:DNA-binding transcriptional LysR family regulator
VVIRTGKVGDSRLKMRSLGSYSYVIVGAPEYFDRRGIPETPEDLSNHSCLYHRWSATGKLERWVFSREGVELNFEPPASTVANTMEPLIELAERGLGVMYTPTFTVRRELAEGTLRSVLEPYVRSVCPLQILWPPSRQPLPKVRAFVDFMARNLLAEGIPDTKMNGVGGRTLET